MADGGKRARETVREEDAKMWQSPTAVVASGSALAPRSSIAPAAPFKNVAFS